MKDLFKEIFIHLVSQEYKTLYVTIRQKQQFISLINHEVKGEAEPQEHHAKVKTDKDNNHKEAIKNVKFMRMNSIKVEEEQVKKEPVGIFN